MDDDLTGLAAELTYRFLLALFPFFIFLAALMGFVVGWFNIQNPTREIMDHLQGQLPQNASSLLEEQLEGVLQSKNAGLLSFGIVAAIWASSSAMNTIIKALNRVYDVEETRPFYKLIPLRLSLTALAGVAFVGGFSVIIAGQLFADDIGSWVGTEAMAVTLAKLARLPLVGLMIMVATAFLYWAAPNVNIPFRWVTPGAVFFIIAWLGATVAFAYYVQNFGSYNETYGTLGGVVVLMVWFYITGLILLVGAEINAITQATIVLEKLSGPAAQEGLVGERRRKAGAAGADGNGMSSSLCYDLRDDGYRRRTEKEAAAGRGIAGKPAPGEDRGTGTRFRLNSQTRRREEPVLALHWHRGS
jgi:membrane protein